MNNGQYLNSIALDSVDKSIGSLNNLPNERYPELRYGAARVWKFRELLGPAGQPVHHTVRVGQGVPGNMVMDTFELCDCAL